MPRPHSPSCRVFRRAAAALLLGSVLLASPASAGPLPGSLETNAPQTIEELKAIQKQVKSVLEKVVPCTVCLQVGGASGSGIIISADGYILTAGHVSGKPDQKVRIVLHDGSVVFGKSLGQNRLLDSGMVKIDPDQRKEPWPFIEMGNSAKLVKGQWVISVGHPGGYKVGRSPVVRLGRLQRVEDSVLTTDCTLVGGDSGGPLFDLDGKVIGIHSKIGETLAVNMHVPVDIYRESWERLAKGDSWSARRELKPWLGLEFADNETVCKITEIKPDSPAAKAGLEVGDTVTTFDGTMVSNREDLRRQLNKKKPGDKVVIEVSRNKETIKLEVVVGKITG